MINLTVCIGTSCHLQGAEEVVSCFQRLIKSQSIEDKIRLSGTFCMGECGEGKVHVMVDDASFRTTPLDAENFFLTQVVPLTK